MITDESILPAGAGNSHDSDCEIASLHKEIEQLSEAVRVYQDRETMFRQLLDDARHGMYIEDISNNSMLYVNPACARFFGTDQATMIREPKSWINPIHPDDLHRIIKKTKRVTRDQNWQYIVDEYRLIQPDGSIRWVRDVTVPIRDAGGNLIRSAGIIEDITERKQAVDDLHEWTRRIEVLHQITRQMAVTESQEFVFLLTIESARRLLGITTCHIGYLENDVMETRAASTGTESMESLFLSLGNQRLLELVKHKETCYMDTSHPDWNSRLEKFGYHSILQTPIGSHGVFQSVSSRSAPLNPNIIRMLELLLGHTHEAISRIQMQETLKQQALHDPLTGVFNRYYLSVYLRQEMKRSERYNRKIGFLMVDIDDFKRINDESGHLIGDKVLVAISRILQSCVRESDTIIRYGGDEFLAILPETNGEVEVVRQRIHDSVARNQEISQIAGFKVRVSIGASHWDPNSAETLENILAIADRQMYSDKRTKQDST